MPHLDSCAAACSSVVPQCLPGVQWTVQLTAASCLFSHPSSGEITFSRVIWEEFFLNMCTWDAKYLLGKGQAKWIPPGVEENGVCEDYFVLWVNIVVISFLPAQSCGVAATDAELLLGGCQGTCVSEPGGEDSQTERGENTTIEMKIFTLYSA